MNAHIKSIAKQKISDFLHVEEGRIGNRTAFTAAALIGASALGTMLFGPAAEAHRECFTNNDCKLNPNGPNCCYVPGSVADYHCEIAC